VVPGTGPVPNPNSRRQTSLAHSWTDLPAGGYQGEVPNWPLPGGFSPAEREMWARYWQKPQAAAWAAMGMVDEVALYVRAFLLGASGNLAAVTEARQWTTPLGLTPSAMLKNRWRVRAVDVPAAAAPTSSSRRTLKVAE
jgi:hypothetical protein